MNEYDFKECKFIYDEMKFYLYDDFIDNCEILRAMFKKYLSENGKIFYKWFVYANIDMNINQKNVIWDFLNGYCTKVELVKYRQKKK